jgi:anti-sigma factor RsiW
MTSEQHLGDALSALLDGELSADDDAAARAHLDACPTCRAALADEAGVRAAVRALPPVDAPFGFYERVLRSGPDPVGKPKRRVRFGMANLVATAAAWVLILAVGSFRAGGEGSVDPAVGHFVTAHASVLPGVGGGGQVKQGHDSRAYNVPDQLAGRYRFTGVADEGGLPQLVYSDGARTLSVFLRPGRLDVAALPQEAQPVLVNGTPAWDVPTLDGDVVFVQRPGMVVVIVGSTPDEAASDVSTGPSPKAERSETIVDHLEAAGQGLLDTFGLRG